MRTEKNSQSCTKGKKLEFNEIEIGMRVVDNDGNVGKVKEIHDEHNVLVVYDNGGSGLHCTIEDCELDRYYDPLFTCEIS